MIRPPFGWPAPAWSYPNPFTAPSACSRTKPPAGRYGFPSGGIPVVCETDTGSLRYDNFEGRWGDPPRLGAFLQRYAVEKTRLESRLRGHTVLERPLPDGSIHLTVQLGAA